MVAVRRESLGRLPELRDNLGDGLVVAQFAAADPVEEIHRAGRDIMAGQAARRHGDGHGLVVGGRAPRCVQLQYSGIRSSFSR